MGIVLISHASCAQSFPGDAENISKWFVTGPDADPELGEDRHIQIIYFDIPESVDSFFVRVYDPEAFGAEDDIRGSDNSTFKYSVAGGTHAHVETDMFGKPPEFLLSMAHVLASREIEASAKSDQKWMVLGPIKTRDGAYYEESKSHRFRFMVEGIAGDDANVFRFALSTDRMQIKKVSGARVFAYHLALVLPDPPGVCHLYPTTIKGMKEFVLSQMNWTSSGGIRVSSSFRKGEVLTPSAAGRWASDTLTLKKGEAGKTIDIQVIRSAAQGQSRMTFCFGRMNGKALPVFVSGAATERKE